jgi:hypothetical protein
MEPDTDNAEGPLTVFYWHEEPDYEDAWWWDEDYEATGGSVDGPCRRSRPRGALGTLHRNQLRYALHGPAFST